MVKFIYIIILSLLLPFTVSCYSQSSESIPWYLEKSLDVEKIDSLWYLTSKPPGARL